MLLVRLGWIAVALGLLLRVVAYVQHDVPRGDVVLDTGVARSLVQGEGFAAGFQRGLALVAGDEAVPRQDLADQHPPLWAVLGATLSAFAGSPFSGLKAASLLAGLLLLVLVFRTADRLLEAVPGVPDGLVPVVTGVAALSFVLVDASGNGSLYVAQAALVLLLVDVLARPRPAPVLLGVLLGAALLLNHQCLVLLPVPLLVLWLGAEPGQRARAVTAGLLAIGIALLLQVPWWWRNAVHFGSPLHSTNAFYFLERAGVPYAFGLEDGYPVARFLHGLTPGTVLSALPHLLPPNLLYLLAAGTVVWPCVLGVLLAGSVGLLARAWGERDRRVLALLLFAAVLLGVALAWPGLKLRYLVAPAPLLLLLGTSVAVRRPSHRQRMLGVAVAVLWLAVLAVTADDVTGSGTDSHPLRWTVLAAGGLLLVLLPLLAHLSRWDGRPRRLLLLSGLPAAPLLALAVLFGPGPGTAYHAAPFLHDVFGLPKEVESERDERALAWAADVLRPRAVAGVGGPVELLGHGVDGLVSLPVVADRALLETLVGAHLQRGAIDHVVLLGEGGATLLGGPPLPGARALGGALFVLAVRAADAWGEAAVVLGPAPP